MTHSLLGPLPVRDGCDDPPSDRHRGAEVRNGTLVSYDDERAPAAILVGMSAVAWGVVVAIVGMFVNLGFNLDNRRRIDAEPGRQVQRQLNDEVRDILGRLKQELNELESDLRSGNDVAMPAGSGLKTAYDDLLRVCSRMTNRGFASEVMYTAAAIARVESYCVMSSSIQGAILQVSVETARSGAGPELSKRERQVQAARQDLREALKKATGQVKARIDYLDRIDRGNAA